MSKMKKKPTPHQFTKTCGILGLFCVALTLASFAISGNPNSWGGIPLFFAFLFKCLALVGLAIQISEL